MVTPQEVASRLAKAREPVKPVEEPVETPVEEELPEEVEDGEISDEDGSVIDEDENTD